MKTYVHLTGIALFVLAFGVLATACSDDDGSSMCNDDGICNPATGETYLTCPGDCPVCNNDGTCDAAHGETELNCPADCPICDFDGICDAAEGETEEGCPSDCTPISCDNDGVCDVNENYGNCPNDCTLCDQDGVCDAWENLANCPADCDIQCNPASFTGPTHEFVVSEILLPSSSWEAGEIGVDIDGDGDIDNKLGQIIQLMVSQGGTLDINAEYNQAIDDGELLLLTRMEVSGQGNNLISLQTLRGLPTGSPPAFDGNDVLQIDPTTPSDLYACGQWVNDTLETSAAPQYLFTPVGMMTMTSAVSTALIWLPMQNVQVRTVTDPDNVYYPTSSVSGTQWQNVMVGGGLTETQIRDDFFPAMVPLIADLIAAGGSEADTVADLYDGNCQVMSDVPGCEAVVAGVGECDNSANPPVITLTELKCNALLHSAFAPDVDSDGDGENDLLSVGYLIVSAVPATLN